MLPPAVHFPVFPFASVFTRILIVITFAKSGVMLRGRITQCREVLSLYITASFHSAELW
jgi:hypothetical protein